MKVKFLIAALFFSLVAAAQPSNYIKFNTRGRWIAGMFDSTLHVPRFNGSPSLRTGGSSMDGAVVVDTVNNILYFYSGGVWSRSNIDTAAAVTVLNISNLRANDYQNNTSKKYNSADKLFVKTLGYYTANDGGGGDFYWDDTATVSDNGGTIIKPTSVSGAGRWKRVLKGQEINVKWFGAKGDGATDDRPAFVNAIAAMNRNYISWNQWSSGTLLIPVPDSVYYLSDSLLFTDQIHIKGEGAAPIFPFSTVKIEFPVNKTGFVLLTSPTLGGISRGNVIENLHLKSRGISSDTTKHGLIFNGPSKIHGVYVEGFGGHGILATTNVGYGGNSNISFLSNVSGQENGLNGLMLTGGESSAFTIINPYFQVNGRCNIEDNGFLGSTIIGGHTAIAGLKNGVISKSWVSHSGDYYICKANNTGIEPGVTSGWENYWQERPSVEIPASVSAWHTDSLYMYAANYAATGAAQAAQAIGLYRESDSGSDIITGTGTMMIGGVGDNITTFKRFGAALNVVDTYLNASGGGGFQTRNIDDIYSYTRLSRDYGLQIGTENPSVTGSISLQAFGDDSTIRLYPSTTANVPRLWFPLKTLSEGSSWGRTGGIFAGLPVVSKFGLFFNDVSTASGDYFTARKRMISAGETYPTVDDGVSYGVGDFIVNTGTDSTVVGWKCVTAGAPGTWQKIKSSNDVTGGGASAFTDLSDVPASYSGQASKLVAVKSDASGLEFITNSGSLPTGLAWDNTAKEFTFGTGILKDNAGNWSRISPAAGALQIFTSGSTGALSIFNTSGSNGISIDAGNRLIASLDGASSLRIVGNASEFLGVGSTPTSKLHVSGSFATAFTSTATGITLNATHSVVEVTATGQTITLPTAVGITGRQYTVKLTASGSATVGTTSSETIDGSTTYSLASQYKYVTVVSNGANWVVTANN